MKTESMVVVGACANARPVAGRVAVAIAVLWLASPALAAESKGTAPSGKTPAVTLEALPGSGAKRVILSARAAERLGIETGKIGSQPVLRRQMVSGLVTRPLARAPEQKAGGGVFSGFGNLQVAMAAPEGAAALAPVAGAWVSVTLSPGEWERLAKDRPARLLPLATREKAAREILAQPTGLPPTEDLKRSMLTLYYVVPGKDHGLALNQRMRVELPLRGNEGRQKVVPYSAVYYDAKGNAWVYVNPKPLVYERQRIGVDRVVGDLAILAEGPPVGTAVVTTGAALLYGAEIFGK